MTGRDPVIVAATRTPIGRAVKGSLASVRPDDLAATVVRGVLDQVPGLDPAELDDLHLGCGEPYDEHGTNLARRVAVQLGLDSLPGVTVNRFCSSSLQTTRMAAHAIRAGEGDAFLSVGVECVSRYADPRGAGGVAPQYLNPLFDEARERTRARSESGAPWADPRAEGAQPDVYVAMGETAENVAALCGVTRREQDELAVRSHRRAVAAARTGVLAREITPVPLADGSIVATDDGPRPDTSYDAIAALRPVFREGGTVTAGNCCPLNDGAAAVLVLSADRAERLGVQPVARILATGVSALSPEIMGLGPVEASRRCLATAGLTMRDVDLVEINEAFAAQVIPCARELGVDPERLNVHGGAIALGHPFGMTGARITATLLNALRARDAEIGLETMCVGGGQGMAMLVQRLL